MVTVLTKKMKNLRLGEPNDVLMFESQVGGEDSLGGGPSHVLH
jgi:hypothetical protein